MLVDRYLIDWIDIGSKIRKVKNEDYYIDMVTKNFKEKDLEKKKIISIYGDR